MSLTYFVRTIVHSLISLIVGLLLLRFILLLIGANANVWFTQFIYGLTDPLMAPFSGITPAVYEQGAVFDFSIIVAMIVYGLLGMLIQWVLTTIDHSAQVDRFTETNQPHSTIR